MYLVNFPTSYPCVPLTIKFFSPFPFFSSTRFFPHSHQISFLFLHTLSCLFSSSGLLPLPKYSSFSSPKRQDRKKLKKKKWEKKNHAIEKEACSNSRFMGLWVYVGIEEEACSSRRRITVFFFFFFLVWRIVIYGFMLEWGI